MSDGKGRKRCQEPFFSKRSQLIKKRFLTRMALSSSRKRLVLPETGGVASDPAKRAPLPVTRTLPIRCPRQCHSFLTPFLLTFSPCCPSQLSLER